MAQALEEITRIRDNKLKTLRKSYADNRLGWHVDDGSAEQDLYAREMKTEKEYTQAIRQAVEKAKPATKHHIESDRNIAYREGWNDACNEYEANLMKFIEGSK